MNKQQFDTIREKYHTTWQKRQAIFLDWIQLKALLDYRITDLIGKDIKPVPYKCDGFWAVQTREITQEEITVIFKAADSNQEERENHEPDTKGTYRSLDQNVSTDLISSYFPFAIDKSIATWDGVYFFSEEEEYIQNYKQRGESSG